MKKAQLSGSLRANVGKKDAGALRRQGMVPCVKFVFYQIVPVMCAPECVRWLTLHRLGI